MNLSDALKSEPHLINSLSWLQPKTGNPRLGDGCQARDSTTFQTSDTNNCQGSWCATDANCYQSCCHEELENEGPN